MEKNSMLSLDELLKEYGFEGKFTNQEKLDILNQILSKCKVDMDWMDLKYSTMPVVNKTPVVRENYVNGIHNLEVKIMNIQGYRYCLMYEMKVERKEKRKQKLQKVIGIFKKNSTTNNQI